ncbi:MAG: hypothetical protein ACKVPX_05715 [Myxococcaceae bacterium]
MKARIWRKLHSTEARRFDQAHALVAKHTTLTLADAFAVISSERPPEALLAKKARLQARSLVDDARAQLDATAVDTLTKRWIEDATLLAVVLQQRTWLDTLVRARPSTLSLRDNGRVEKLRVLAMTPSHNVGDLPSIPRERPTRPVAVPKEPERRPVWDPRPFEPWVGHTVRGTLRNGMRLYENLLAVGPFDIVLGTEGREWWVPLHALSALDRG